jgi:hypothetical protein
MSRISLGRTQANSHSMKVSSKEMLWQVSLIALLSVETRVKLRWVMGPARPSAA